MSATWTENGLRILYLADIRFPLERANGIQTMETAYALTERQHEVTLGVRPDTTRPARDPFVFHGRDPNQRLVNLFFRDPHGIEVGTVRRAGRCCRQQRNSNGGV